MVLVTGAGGFLGRHVARAVLERKEGVRCLVRKLTDKAKLEGFGAEAILGDVLEPRSLEKATEGVWAVYHLVHGFESDPKGPTLEAIDQQGARNLLHACVENGARRFVYVSILGATASATSRLLASRWLTEELIRGSGLDFTILRTGFVIGRGSKGFETLLSLVTRFPLVPLPGNRNALHQPIALSEVLSYLTRCLDEPRTVGKTFDGGGPDRLTYGAMVDQMAQALGRSRPTVNLPLGVVRGCLSFGQKVGLKRAGILLEAIANMQVDMVCGESEIREIFPGPTKTFRESFAEYMTMDP